MSRDNFKDDFEKNRQSIDSNDQFDRVNNETNDEIDNFNNETDQQFPPRNAQRRHRRRNQSSSRNKKFNEQVNDYEEGSLDDRYDENIWQST